MKSQLKIFVGQDYDHSADETNSKHVIGAQGGAFLHSNSFFKIKIHLPFQYLWVRSGGMEKD